MRRLYDALKKKRFKRILKLALKSYLFGYLLQIEFFPITFVRDNVVLPYLFSPKPFLEHTSWAPPPTDNKSNINEHNKAPNIIPGKEVKKRKASKK